MLRYLAIAYFALATALQAQTVFVNSHILANAAPGSIGFSLSKDGQPPPFNQPPLSCVECDTGIHFEYDGAKINATVISLDEGSDWFLVQPGDIFSAATINGGKFPTIVNLNPPPQGGEVTVGSGEFFLGVRTSRGNIANRNAYGWVHLRPDNGVLTMVENVMSYNSRGIIVGTTTVVPEPSVLASIGIAIALATVLSRRGQLRRAADGWKR